ncbi:MAG: DMT family transporter [Opitutales bacterium]
MSRSYGEALGAIAVMCLVPVLIKVTPADPWVVGTSRLVLAAALTWALLPRARAWQGLTRRQLLALAAIGGIFGIHWMSYFWAIVLSTAQLATIGVATYGLQLTVLGALIQKEPVRSRHWLALGMSLGGLLLVTQRIEAGGTALWGFLLAVFSGTCYALLPIIHQRARSLGNDLRTFGQYGFGLVAFSAVCWLGEWGSVVKVWPNLLFLGIVGTFVGHTLWVRATTSLPTTVSALLYYLYVPGACLVSFLVIGERLTWPQIGGTVLILAGSLLGILSRTTKAAGTPGNEAGAPEPRPRPNGL